MKFWTARNGFFNLLQKQRFLLNVFSLLDWYELLKFSSQYLMTVSSNVEAGATAEKDNIWRAATEKVWDARRLWMGRRVTRMVQWGQSLLVAWKQGLQPQSMMPNATLLLFLGGFQNLSLPLVIIYNFISSPIFFFFIFCLVVNAYACLLFKHMDVIIDSLTFLIFSISVKTGKTMYFNNPMWPGGFYSHGLVFSII